MIVSIDSSVALRNGVKMPYLGLGTYQSDNDEEVIEAVKHAVSVGYRLIDTASIYKNEEGVGKGIRACGIPREALFVTSKVWNSDQGFQGTLDAFEQSLNRLGLEYLDLYLVHWPVAGKYVGTWRAMEQLYREKKIRAIGVSNFMQHHLEELMGHTEIVPMVNQMEFHPYVVQQPLIDFCHKNNIRYQAWSPFMQGKVFGIEAIKELAEKYQKSVAQLVLRWSLQKGVATIPKSVKAQRITDNAAIFDFELTQTDMDFLDGLDRGERIGPHPDNFDF